MPTDTSAGEKPRTEWNIDEIVDALMAVSDLAWGHDYYELSNRIKSLAQEYQRPDREAQ